MKTLKLLTITCVVFVLSVFVLQPAVASAFTVNPLQGRSASAPSALTSLQFGQRVSATNISGSYSYWANGAIISCADGMPSRCINGWCRTGINNGFLTGGFYTASNSLISENIITDFSSLNGVVAPAGAASLKFYFPDDHQGDNTGSCNLTVSTASSCAPHASQRCVGNSVYWFDSCNVQQELIQTCSSNQICSNGSCVNNCVSHTTQKCVGNNVYWFNSCNDQEELKQNCSSNQICLNGNCTIVACSSNTDCGTNGYEGSPFCQGNSIYKNFRTYTCNNPGSANSSCSSSTAPLLLNNCSANQICSGGGCSDINIACRLNSQCGANGFVNSPFCQNGNVYQDFKTYTCNNPGSANSSCSSSTAPQLKTDCAGNQTCSNGSCINQNIPCSSNTDCGTNGYEGSPFCQGNSIYRNFRTYTCNNPGASGSTCISSINPQLFNNCSSDQVCSNGSCSVQNNLVASCYATPSPANSNQNVSFIATATGGNGIYTYSWSGACSGAGQVCANTFSQSGTQTATVNVTSDSQTTSAVCSVNINQSCAQQASQRCVGNNVYWYDSCGNQGNLIQTCGYNQNCQNGNCQNNQNNCSYHSYQRCVGNYLYWYDSCGIQQDYQYCQNGCSNGYCQTVNNYNYTNLTVNVTAKNLTTGLGWYSSIAANPSDMLMFMITLVAQGNQGVNNVFVRDILPYGLVYKNNLVVSGSNGYGGDVTSGINIGTISAGQTVTITYQAQVGPASNFIYGTSILTDNASVTSSGNNPNVSNAIVSVNRTAVYGATSVSTGLTNNFLVDSFFLPLMIALLGLWLFRSGLFGFEKWADKKKISAIRYKAKKQLKAKIAEIQKKEKL
ncbi:MAG: hypothetical protein A3G45_03355 [Candidatus Staskawiczbacteria bacterium RIFCSPLOWO2_12_FULL_37_15]|uniref:DUF11 domain-containing protein n=1 Tax=Candidatus Staskawiczbacteria bacterium RIFCSPLOWO2_12_FULL_37_15 TaxID=1802218 RepID=A0A1G2IM77_9BACT|nr:MAG: hypothetical protein A3G45_03355 [Candidatus Staskawiczbacteria bacterium RIFCSPLOWO2_12_FULL_37_15]